MGCLTGHKKLFGKYPKEYYQKILLYVFGLGTRLLNPKIIYCSHRSKEVHEKAFFSSANQSVIVNRLAKVPDLNFDAFT